jgi:quinone-modifying oxidoreductase subunit QmoA
MDDGQAPGEVPHPRLGEVKAAADHPGWSHGRRLLILGGGVAGMTAAIEAAEVGCEVVLLEREPYLGGRVAQMHLYFPKLCPPACGMEINLRRIRQSPRITVHTQATVTEVSGGPRAYRVGVRQEPRFVAEHCTACGKCAEVCPAERPSAFDFGMRSTRAAYLAYPGAWPARYTIDRAACAAAAPCTLCASACPNQAIDLSAPPRTFVLEVDALVWATGWRPYEATRLTDLGFGRHPDVVTNMMFERLASPHGPTAGQIRCPSDGRAPASVAFVQCAGSRDDAHLSYCSGLCCLATAKHVRYLRAQHPGATIHVYYIDRRASGRHETFLAETERDENVHYVPGKVARISGTGPRPILEVEDTARAVKLEHEVDLVVLATGMVPVPPAVAVRTDDHGHLAREQPSPGQLVAGSAQGPMDVATTVRDATSAVMRALAVMGDGA